MTGPSKEHPIGYEVLHSPRLNKGTAFTEEERRAYGREGLLPAAVTTIDLQIARRHARSPVSTATSRNIWSSRI
jgi:malate dehydrogenase (oxaloacetate-decarboxylating)(NADP+)